MARTPRTLAAFAACLAGAGLAGAVIATQAQALETNVGNVDLFIDTTTSAGVQVRTASRQTRFLPQANNGPQDTRALSGRQADETVEVGGGGTQSAPSMIAMETGSLFVPFTARPDETPAQIQAAYGDRRPDSNPDNFSGSINTDDGRLNFDRGDLTGATLKMTNDIEATFQNFVLFSRVTSFYDAVIDSNSYYKRSGLTDGAREDVGRGIELLDFYVGGNFAAGEWPLNLRLGKQVISWGEGTFLFGGINVINPIDITAFRRPGAEIKEGLIPVWAAYGSVGLPYDLSLEGFYQLKWDDFELDRPGTPFANSDVARVGSAVGGNVGGAAFTSGASSAGTFRRNCDQPGGVLPAPIRTLFANGAPVPGTGDNPALPISRDDGCFDYTTPIAFGDNERVRFANDDKAVVFRGKDEDPVDSGQYGAALRWYSEALGSTEFGLYYVNYHSRLPFSSQRTVANTVGIVTTGPATTALSRQIITSGCLALGAGGFGATGDFFDPRLKQVTTVTGEPLTTAPDGDGVTTLTLASPELRSIEDLRNADGDRYTGAMGQDPDDFTGGTGFNDPNRYLRDLVPAADAAAGALSAGLPGFAAIVAGGGYDVVYSTDTVAKLAAMNCAFGLLQAVGATDSTDPVASLGYSPAIEGGISNALPSLLTGSETLALNTQGEFFFEYPEDIKMVGVSFNTTVGDWGVQGEMSYRSNQPFQLDTSSLTIATAVLNCAFPAGGDVTALNFEPLNVNKQVCSPSAFRNAGQYTQGYKREKMYTAQVGTTAIFTGSHPISDFLGSDISILVTEVGGIYVPDVPESPYLGTTAATRAAAVATQDGQFAGVCTAGSDLPLGGLLALDFRAGCRPDTFSWGYVLLGTAQYNNAFGSAWTVSPQVIWSHDVKGNSPAPIGTYREKSKAMSLGVTGTYQSTWRIGLRYTDFFGDELFTRETDRDFASFDVSYSF